MPSATVRPTSTEDREMGRARNRSTSPLFRSPTTPTAVVVMLASITCAKMPAMMYSL